MTQPGEIYLADFDEGGRHPIIVISRESLNRGNYVLVVVCTSARFALRRNLSNCVPFQAGQFGFTKDCVAQCENLLLLHNTQLDLVSGPIGVLDIVYLHNVVKTIGYVVVKTIGYVLDADCELL